MRLIIAFVAIIALGCVPQGAAFAAPQPDECDVPASLIESEIDFTRATDQMKEDRKSVV